MTNTHKSPGEQAIHQGPNKIIISTETTLRQVFLCSEKRNLYFARTSTWNFMDFPILKKRHPYVTL